MKRTLASIAVITTLTASLALSAAAGPVSKSSGSSLSSFLHQNAPSRTIKNSSSGKAVVTNTGSTVVLVNKKRPLSSLYKPGDLVVPNVPFSFSGNSEKKQMRNIAAAALEKLFAGAKADGISIKAVSGFRSYKTQEAIFNRNAKIKGAAVANKTSARPGQSEHQTGLAMDVSSASVKYGLEQSFGSTKEGKWLKAHAAEYGFIIRYPQGKEKITGYSYEPWHIRYVGVYIAGQITKQQLTLEEYMAKQE
ncbi:M15 family metallopeptidase [Paenibacillus oenotherae]|uniref:M15 family metallopeptidase n=1 Tax=Paenibacillus oenotherae TaxID=1435645 RepID=A0ABS7D434_9BACL|nr:M15 family metallopeptidase [Paenibacillus oenotherae]MBW7474682.1 M15 family metallopeptidase [Paenibacillus oenotherae]